jgi:hypothetical protein
MRARKKGALSISKSNIMNGMPPRKTIQNKSNPGHPDDGLNSDSLITASLLFKVDDINMISY